MASAPSNKKPLAEVSRGELENWRIGEWREEKKQEMCNGGGIVMGAHWKQNTSKYITIHVL